MFLGVRKSIDSLIGPPEHSWLNAMTFLLTGAVVLMTILCWQIGASLLANKAALEAHIAICDAPQGAGESE